MQIKTKVFEYQTNLTLNLLNGELQFGTWQRIMFVELDRARTRKIQVLLSGE
ncbi:hypothetical protein COX24_00100 [bacterium (Candidatus Gribaldobacteria) CG23_combo_of_CG06-09_8_20_14_all_37_87_8]|uniref:Secondary thiamine-phosphate synthase enzyme n=2 Tax=Candidatus Gribaldobacteria TaxID=2798536 RepID=A0A2G9ZFY3_9BACT|nr:MAG: hypothetical protein COX24_00100 [bacterium (Candidatus Gribaldobacteria) CG23_combo_of_CG06-09_8_20_14_all_37_87_8]PIR90578.1 MAG: hypothetical protein COU05_01380 [bacterium (Candidatus Gribaldobacteria) CG10_big_fil_rev_8_21_14_0_10_37_21]